MELHDRQEHDRHRGRKLDQGSQGTEGHAEGQPALCGQGHSGDQQPDHQRVVVARGDETEECKGAQGGEPQGEAGVGAQPSGEAG